MQMQSDGYVTLIWCPSDVRVQSGESCFALTFADDPGMSSLRVCLWNKSAISDGPLAFSGFLSGRDFMKRGNRMEIPREGWIRPTAAWWTAETVKSANKYPGSWKKWTASKVNEQHCNINSTARGASSLSGWSIRHFQNHSKAVLLEWKAHELARVRERGTSHVIDVKEIIRLIVYLIQQSISCSIYLHQGSPKPAQEWTTHYTPPLFCNRAVLQAEHDLLSRTLSSEHR